MRFGFYTHSLRQAERLLQIVLSDGNTVADDACGWTAQPLQNRWSQSQPMDEKVDTRSTSWVLMRTEALGYDLLANDFKQIHFYF